MIGLAMLIHLWFAEPGDKFHMPYALGTPDEYEWVWYVYAILAMLVGINKEKAFTITRRDK